MLNCNLPILSYDKVMVKSGESRFFVSHDRSEETPESKARWFQSLSLEERMEIFCAYTDLILSINPNIADRKDVKPVAGRILVLTR
jgi:hypothetical protein